MKISEITRCEKSSEYQEYITNTSDNFIIAGAMTRLVKVMVEEDDRTKALVEFNKYLEEKKNEREISAVSADKRNENDGIRAERFLNTFVESKFIESGLEVSAEVDNKVYTQNILAIVKKEDGIHAIVMRYGTNDKSVRGGSLKTQSFYDERAIVAKIGLETKYPGVKIDSYYFKNCEDTVNYVSSLPTISSKKNTDVYTNEFDKYYADGVFLEDDIKSDLSRIIMMYRGEMHNCQSCRFMGICQSPKVEINPSKKLDKKPFRLPKFTDEQMEIVGFKDGYMRVCACAGSGKTTSLVGRAVHLAKQGVQLPQLLILAYNEQAVLELTDRCSSIFERGMGPKISTIHAMCFEILKHAESIVGPIEIMTDVQKNALVRAALLHFENEPIEGLPYGCSLYGSRGLLPQVVGLLEAYEKDPTGFEVSHTKIDMVKFEKLFKNYKFMIAANNYVSFDDLITKCNELLETHPEVLSVYQSIYRYMMVDEYQDINPAQERFIDLLSARSKNLVVVGDDDQAIYKFRGAESKFFIGFVDRHEGCKQVVLNQNFRTTAAMVEASNRLITNNKERVDKAVISMGEIGREHYFVDSVSKEAVQKCIDKALELGYSYDDIAIISSKNDPLEKLYKELKCPTYLAKSFLRNDGMFHLCRSVMHLCEDEGDEEALYIFINILNRELRPLLSLVKDSKDSLMSKICRIAEQDINNLDPKKKLYKELSFLNAAKKLYEQSKDAKTFVKGMVNMIGYDASNFAQVMCDQIEQQALDKEGLRKYCDLCVEQGCSIAVDASSKGRIALVTMHGSKGTEYKVTIVLNDFKAELTEERRRTMYVAITRAKELSFILQGPDAQIDFASEIPGIVLDEKTIISA